jgi:hypothetical protein
MHFGAATGVEVLRFAERVDAAGMAHSESRQASVHELSALNISRMMQYANDENTRWLG